jgi:hypothetical protein
MKGYGYFFRKKNEGYGNLAGDVDWERITYNPIDPIILKISSKIISCYQINPLKFYFYPLKNFCVCLAHQLVGWDIFVI